MSQRLPTGGRYQYRRLRRRFALWALGAAAVGVVAFAAGLSVGLIADRGGSAGSVSISASSLTLESQPSLPTSLAQLFASKELSETSSPPSRAAIPGPAPIDPDSSGDVAVPRAAPIDSSPATGPALVAAPPAKPTPSPSPPPAARPAPTEEAVPTARPTEAAPLPPQGSQPAPAVPTPVPAAPQAAAPQPAPPTPQPTPEPPPVVISSYPSSAEQLLALVNDERSKAGLGTLALNGALVAAAQAQAEGMSTQGILSHQLPGGPSLEAKVKAAGYVGWSALGEAVAQGPDSPEAVLALWLGSASHRATILNGAYADAGVAHYYSTATGHFWALELGRR
jgi:uncharacterized protein YkwD